MKQVLCVAAAALALSGCGAAAKSDVAATPSVSPSASPSKVARLEAAANLCTVRSNLADGGKSLTLDTMGKDETSGDDLESIACVLGAMKAPEYVINHIDSTRALDGQQTDTWDDYEARWTYHPDAGLNFTIIDRSS